MTSKNNRAPLLYCIKLYAPFLIHPCIQTVVTVRKHSIQVKIADCLSHIALKFDRWYWKRIGHLFYSTPSFMHHFVAIYEFKLELQSGNAQFGSNSIISLAVWPWNLMDGWPWKNNRSPLLSNIKLCASFHHHMWLGTGVTVRKRLNWVLTSVTLTFDIWSWTFAWISLLSLVITPENCMMIRWGEHSGKGDRRTDRQTDRQTDRRTGPFIDLLGCS